MSEQTPLPRTVSDRAERTAADHFRRVGELEARIGAHDDRLDLVEERLRTYDGRAQQIQAQIVRLATLCESTATSLSTVERFREDDHKELRAALIDALKAAPRANRAGSALGMVLAALALAAVIVMLMTRVH